MKQPVLNASLGLKLVSIAPFCGPLICGYISFSSLPINFLADQQPDATVCGLGADRPVRYKLLQISGSVKWRAEFEGLANPIQIHFMTA